jgi:hypothetical protein
LLLMCYGVWLLFFKAKTWPGPLLSVDAAYPPLVFFDSASPYDPGLYRLLIKIRQPLLAAFRDELPKFVAVESKQARQPLVPFVEVWEHENVLEIRIPLVRREERAQTITCVVAPLGRTFHLRADRLPSPPVAIREISVLDEAQATLITLANRTGSPVVLSGFRLNGSAVSQQRAIRLPAHRQTRIVVQGIADNGPNTSVVLLADGGWIQAYEVATSSDFRFHEWEGVDTRPEMAFDQTGVLSRHGGPVADPVADVCASEQARFLSPGFYLADLKTLLAKASQALRSSSPQAAVARGNESRSHTFIFLNEGNRPRSHYIYGRLSDYVGVAAFAPRQSNTDIRDVAFWLGMDRAIVEPRHLMAIPGVFRRQDRPGRRLSTRDIRRLVLAALASGPTALLYYRYRDEADIVGYGHDPDYERAIASLNADLAWLKPFLKAALPVKWIYRKTSGHFVKDRYGTSGFFTLWSGPDHLLVLSLGYAASAWLRLPQGISLREHVMGADDILGEQSQGYIELRNGLEDAPRTAVVRLDVHYVRDGELAWLSY